MDKTSELPQVLLQHIQYYLSPKQSAQTLILSKAWLNTWSNRPNIDVIESLFQGTRDEFIPLLNSTLQRYHDHKLRVKDFRLLLSKPDSACFSLLDKWIPILIHMGVNKFGLTLHTFSDTYYNLPRAVNEAESIIELSLKGCRLSDQDKIMFKHLKRLELFRVYIDDKTFEKIISNCPLIEDMRLRDCDGLRNIKLNDLQNLNKFSFSYYDHLHFMDVRSIEWGVTNLKSITIYSYADWFQVHKFQVFANLKHLSLNSVCLSGISMCDFSCYFPSLEYLELGQCYGFEEIQILSRSIRHIRLMGIHWSIKARVNAPNILLFEFAGIIPSTLSFAETLSTCKSVMHLDLKYNVSLWLKLKEILMELSQSEIYLHLHNLPKYDHQSEKIVVHFDPVDVKELRFPCQKYYSSAMINDLFYVCRPKKVYISWYANEDGYYGRGKNEFAEFMCKMLMDMGEYIWRKDLNEVKSSIYNGSRREWHPLHGTSLSECACINDKCQNQIRFELKWRKDTLLAG